MSRLVWEIPGLNEALIAVLRCYPLGHYRWEATRLDGADSSRGFVSSCSHSKRQVPPAVHVLDDLWHANGWAVRIEAKPLRSAGELVGAGEGDPPAGTAASVAGVSLRP